MSTNIEPSAIGELFQDEAAVKEWLDRQDRVEPFAVGWPSHKRVPVELGSLGFTDVSVQQIAPHPVFVYRGCTGSTGCDTEEALRRIVKKLARYIGFRFRSADTALSVHRKMFQLVICFGESK